MRDFIQCMAMVVLYFVLLALLPACSQIVYTAPDGQRASYLRMGNQEISGLKIERDKNGMYRIVLDKQHSDADTTLAAIKELIK